MQAMAVAMGALVAAAATTPLWAHQPAAAALLQPQTSSSSPSPAFAVIGVGIVCVLKLAAALLKLTCEGDQPSSLAIVPLQEEAKQRLAVAARVEVLRRETGELRKAVGEKASREELAALQSTCKGLVEESQAKGEQQLSALQSSNVTEMEAMQKQFQAVAEGLFMNQIQCSRAEWSLKDTEVAGCAKDQFLQSPLFLLRGVPVWVRFYPQGDSRAPDGRCSLFLYTDAEVELKFQITLDDGATRTQDTWRKFTAQEGFGWPDFGPASGAFGSVTVELLGVRRSLAEGVVGSW